MRGCHGTDHTSSNEEMWDRPNLPRVKIPNPAFVPTKVLPEKSLREANRKRQAEWDPSSAITLTYRATELAGEVGEACNNIKKLERERLGIPGSRTTMQDVAEELADVVICVDLLAADLGINLDKAVAEKFNKTSRKVGLKTLMEVPEE